MKDEQADTSILAYHEAGHAVITWALKVKLLRVTVRDFKGKVIGGAIRLYLLDPEIMSTSEWTQVKNKALILLAGEAAERAYYESNELYCDEYLSEYDRRELSDLLMKFGEYECPPVALSEDALKIEAGALVTKHWNQIKALAKELMNNVEMHGDEAVRIIESTKKHKRWFNRFRK